MPSVATAMLVDMVGEAGGLELAVLVGGAVLRVLVRHQPAAATQVGVALAPGVGSRFH